MQQGCDGQIRLAVQGGSSPACMYIHSQNCHCLGCCTAVSTTAAHARQDMPRLQKAPPATPSKHHHPRSLPAKSTITSWQMTENWSSAHHAEDFGGTQRPRLLDATGKHARCQREECMTADILCGGADYLCAKAAPSGAIRGRSNIQALYVGAAGVGSEYPDRPAAHPAVWQAHHQH